jgi:hypothetical protein
MSLNALENAENPLKMWRSDANTVVRHGKLKFSSPLRAAYVNLQGLITSKLDGVLSKFWNNLWIAFSGRHAQSCRTFVWPVRGVWAVKRSPQPMSITPQKSHICLLPLDIPL